MNYNNNKSIQTQDRNIYNVSFVRIILLSATMAMEKAGIMYHVG